MLLNGKAFKGTIDYEVTDIQLRLCTGNSHVSCIAEFSPVVFPYSQMIHKLLLALHIYNLICFLTGTYALVVGGQLDTFDGITIFIALTDPWSTPILSWLFKNFEYPPALHFAIDEDFTFDLVNRVDADKDLFHYHVSYGGSTLQVSLMGLDTSEHCCPQSNIDLVYFMWENFLRFSYKKFAIALSSRSPQAQPELMLLKHYRVQSDGWKDIGLCVECMDNHQEMILPFYGCDLSVDCKCKMCTRQPPSLADSARHVLFNYTISRQILPWNGYTIRSIRVRGPFKSSVAGCPMITIWYCNDIDSPFKFHRDCLGAGSWLNQSERKYN